MDTRHFVVIGDTTTARQVCAALSDRGLGVKHLLSPDDAELTSAVLGGPAGVAVLLHQDEMSLRYVLASSHLAPDVPVVAAVFDATMSEQLELLVPNCVVRSPGDLAAPVIAAACLNQNTAAIVPAARNRGTAFVIDGDDVRVEPWVNPLSARRRFARQVRPHDAGSWLMFLGLLGISLALLADWIWLTRHGVAAADALQEAASVVATVGPVAHLDDAYAVFSAASILATIVFTSMFTAGLVDLLLGPRLVSLFGKRTLPRSGHVVVVGLGQVGLRLCRHLQTLGIPVVGVERDADSRYVGIARNLGIPLRIGHGSDRLVLERLRLRHALALAAVGSSDLDNIAVAIAARGVSPSTPVVLRTGEHEQIGESASLLPLGVARDVTGLSAAFVVARLLEHDAELALPHGPDFLVGTSSGVFVPWESMGRAGCVHRSRQRSGSDA